MIHERLKVVPQSAAELDDITAFLPGISDAEYKLRRRLRSARNVAVKAIGDTPDGIARNLFILLREHADAWAYAPASLAELAEIVEQAQRLYVAADNAIRWEGPTRGE